MLRSAASVLLASAPLFTAMPAQAAAPQPAFPCAVGVQKVNGAATSEITVSIHCRDAQTVGMRITADGVELASLQQAVRADAPQRVTLTVPKVRQVCATLLAHGQSVTTCAPAAVTLPAPA